MVPGIVQQATDRIAATGIMVTDVFVGQGLDGTGGCRIPHPCTVIVEEVTEIRADDQQGFPATPESLDDLGDLFCRCIADHQRNQREGSQQPLQEGQVNLETVFKPVSVIIAVNLWQQQDVAD